jgi:hypothetical protein
MQSLSELLQALNQLRLVIEVGRHQGGLNNVADLVDSFIDSPRCRPAWSVFRPCQVGPK